MGIIRTERSHARADPRTRIQGRTPSIRGPRRACPRPRKQARKRKGKQYQRAAKKMPLVSGMIPGDSRGAPSTKRKKKQTKLTRLPSKQLGVPAQGKLGKCGSDSAWIGRGSCMHVDCRGLCCNSLVEAADCMVLARGAVLYFLRGYFRLSAWVNALKCLMQVLQYFDRNRYADRQGMQHKQMA